MNPRHVRTIVPLLAAGALASLCLGAESRPNIVFFLADDLGQRDLGCYGSTFYETPNLDRMARDGARFTDAYAACPVCSPTRASIMSGMWPQRTGVTDYIGAPMRPEAWKRNTRALPAPYADRLELGVRTIAESLKGAGYATFFAGKWHLGPEGHWPENQGFDVNMGGTDRGGPYGGKQYFSPYANPRLPDGPPGEHLPDRLATEAAKFIEANKSRPFLVYFSFYDVHTPLMARPDLLEKYLKKRETLGLTEKWGREGPREVRLTQDHAVYAAMVEAMDQAVGKVLAKLDEAGLREKTLVVFTSDNGGLSTSEGWPTSNAPLRAGKGWIYEGGIREPLIFRWPGKVKAGMTVEIPVSSPDFLPTILEAAGVKEAAGQAVDGISLLPLFAGRSLPERPLFWHYPHYGNQGGAPAAAVRSGDWKLIEWLEDGRTELYQLSADPGERVDLAAKEPARVRHLLERLRAWQKDTGAKFPVKNPAYDPAKPDGRIAHRPGAKKGNKGNKGNAGEAGRSGTSGAVSAATGSGAGKPNIVFLFTDDQAAEMVAGLGEPDADPVSLRTPNMDRLVTSGVSFSRAYNMGSWSGAVCVASRSMLNTGCTLWRARQTEKDKYRRLVTGGRMWSQRMKAAGYETWFSGKWHVETPVAELFDHAKNVRLGMPTTVPAAYQRPVEGKPDAWLPWDESNGGYWEGGKHWSEVLADDAEEFIREAAAKKKPFFLYLAFNAPHDPRQSPKSFVDAVSPDKVRLPANFMPLNPHHRAMSLGPTDRTGLRDEVLAPFPRTGHAIRTHRREYCALVNHLDVQIGRILDAIERAGVAGNTQVVLTSDHGLAVGRHGLMGKQNMYEHSLRVPLVIRGPGIPAGEKRTDRVYMQDAMATCLEWAGADRDGVEFRSLLPVVRGEGAREVVYGAYLAGAQRAIIVGDHKLILYPADRTVLLFDLSKDPLEKDDIAGREGSAAIKKRLFLRLLEEQKALGDPLDLSRRFPDLAG